MSNLRDKIKTYFYIPPKAKLELSKRNVKIYTYLAPLILLYGVLLLCSELFIYHSSSIVNIIYYLCFICNSLLFYTGRIITRKKNSHFTNQFLIMMVCSIICFLMYFNIADVVNTHYIMNFYFAIVIMIMAFELTPVFYTFAIIIFFAELVYCDMKTTQNGLFLYLNNGLFCAVLIFFSFYKRKLVSIRELARQEIEEKNRQLNVRNIALSRQRDLLLVKKQYLENTVFTQSQEYQLQNERILKLQDNTIVSLSNLVENRDEDTGSHVLRTRDYVELIATKAYLTGEFPELDETTIKYFVKAAPMHDIGKIVVPDAVLKKPGKLTPEEFELIKMHAAKGGEIVQNVLGTGADADYVRVAKEIAKYHHEKYDGTGYPEGKKGTDIPLSARIMAIADVFDALVSPRCYKDPMPVDKAFSIIAQEAGTHFDPELSRIFLDSKEDVIAIMDRNYEK